ncbi:MAG: efflux RND transporter periplasmic adaptor subunit [Gemmatimonadaceae bacterium]
MKSVLPPLVAALLLACGGGDDDAQPSRDSAAGTAVAAPVVLGPQDLATATTRAISSAIHVSGNLDPAEVVQLRAQIPGTVQGVRVDRGSTVRRGNVLAVIEAAGVRSQAAAARAQEALARQRLEASKRLYDAGAISAIEYQSAQASYEAARAAAAAASESAARATITAPINGVVSARFVSGGEAVSPGTALFTIVNATELELAGRVGVQDAARVRPGQPVTFTLDAFPNQVFRGRVARVDPTADPGTRQVGVYVRLANPGHRIVGGQYARGRIETGATQQAVVIPEAAISARSGNNAVVFVLTGNRVSRHQVTLGERDEASGLVAVVAGVQNGDRVLLNPSPEIGDGTLVSVAAETSARPDTVR